MTGPTAPGLPPAAADLPPGSPTHVLLVTGVPPDDMHTFRLNPTAGLAERFLVRAAGFATSVRELSVVDYAPGRKPDAYEVAALGTADVPGLDTLLATFETPANAALFQADSPAARSLRLYAVAIESPSLGWVHFLRRMTIRSRLRRSGKIAAVFAGAVYSELEEDPLLFDPTFDAVAVDGRLYVVRQRNFETALGFLEAARAAVAETLTMLTANLRIANADDLMTAATQDINMIAKLRSIGIRISSRPDYAAALTMARVVDFAQARPDLAIDLEGPAGQEQLVFHNDPQRRWRIFKLLDDDFLHSELTNLNYEANSKIDLR